MTSGSNAGVTGRQPFAMAVLLALVLAASTAHATAVYRPSDVLVDPQGLATANFGDSTSVSGDVAMIGESQFAHSGLGPAGAVLVYVRRDGRWVFAQRILSPFAANGENFGYAVAVDGDTAVIGARCRSAGILPCLGIAYIFIREADGDWIHQATLEPSPVDWEDFHLFGTAVAISQDCAVVGAPGQGTFVGDPPTSIDFSGDNDGVAYVYCRYVDSGLVTWPLRGRLLSPNGQADGGPGQPEEDGFGSAVAIHEGAVIVGSGAETTNDGFAAGNAYVFDRRQTGCLPQPSDPVCWSSPPTSKLTPALPASAFDQFGSSVDVSGDTAAVSAYTATVAGAARRGYVSLYRRVPDGPGFRWLLMSPPLDRVMASDGQVGDEFGLGLSLTGNRLGVSAWKDDIDVNQDQGSVYVYQQIGGAWQEVATALSRGSQNDMLSGVALSGNTLFAFTPLADTGGMQDRGRAYVFNDTGSSDLLRPDLVLPQREGAAEDAAGTSVAVAKDIVVVGAPTDGSGAGEVLILQRASTGPPSTPFRSKGSPTGPVLARLAIPGGSIGDKFGAAVDATPSGERVVVGAPGRNGDGEVAIFNKPAGGWIAHPGIPDATISAPSAGGNAIAFGAAVAVAQNGNVAIGAPDADVGADTDAGIAFAIELDSGGNYDLPANASPMTADVPASEGNFGYALDIDATRVVVGEPFEGLPAATSPAGKVHVFLLDQAFAQRGAQPKRAASTRGGGIGDKFGSSVSMSGALVAVGAPGTDTPASSDDRGSGYLYSLAGTSLGLLRELKPDATSSGAAGRSVSLFVDTMGGPDAVVLGAPLTVRDGHASSGAAFLFAEPPGGWSASTPVTFSELASSVVTRSQRHGLAVAIDAEGTVVGVPGRPVFDPTGPIGLDQGAVESFVVDRLLRDGFE